MKTKQSKPPFHVGATTNSKAGALSLNWGNSFTVHGLFHLYFPNAIHSPISVSGLSCASAGYREQCISANVASVCFVAPASSGASANAQSLLEIEM